MKSNVLLVEPKKSLKYHTAYPPLGLLKLGAYHKKQGDKVRLYRGIVDNGFEPDIIYITSLFTYAWEPVHEVIRFYRNKYKKAEVIIGGIYATLCPEHLRKEFGYRIKIHRGLMPEIENIKPDYSLVPDWDSSILFASRGCIRKCPFCSVAKLEPVFQPRESIKHLVHPEHKRIIFWDNNILASPYWRNIFDELERFNKEVDFNQGLDARLLTEDIALRLKRLRIPIIRLAYDSMGIRIPLEKAVNLLKGLGVDGRRISVYCIYNHKDKPEDFLNRMKDLLTWGVVTYPMRYEPLKPGRKNRYISPYWTAEQLEMLAKARRVIGYGGAFPPYEGLRKKILRAKSFDTAFKLRVPKR